MCKVTKKMLNQNQLYDEYIQKETAGRGKKQWL